MQPGSIPIGKLRKDLEIFHSEDSASESSSWTIFDPVNGRYYKLFDRDYKIISGLCADYTFDEYLAYLQDVMKLEVDKVQLNSTLFFLKNNGLMLPDFAGTEKKLEKILQLKKSMWFSRVMSAYLFLRVPIWKPDKFLDRTVDSVKYILNRWVLLILSLISGTGYVLIVVNWNRFMTTIMDSLTYSGLIRYGLIIIIVKFFHELAHAYSAKSMGIRVRHIGIGLIVFFPRFYTDITDSWKITDRKKRALIDASGILLELLIGGIAAFLWINSSPGTMNTICYYIFTVSIINTILINGNPLIRYDGYYLLSDLLGIDNLQNKSIELWERIFDRIIFGIKLRFKDVITGSGKTCFCVLVYGIVAFFYRLFLYSSIVLIIYFKFTKALGIFLAMVEIQLMFIRPIMIQVKRISSVRKRAIGKNSIISIISTVVLLLVLFLPLPWNIASPCIIKARQFSVIYMPFEVFFEKIYVRDGTDVKAGQLIAEFKNPFIDWDLREYELWLDRACTELDQIKSNLKNIETVRIKAEQIKKLENKISELRNKQKEFKVYAPFPGVFYLKDRNLNPGKRMAKGELFGFIKCTDSPEIYAFVNEEDVNKIIPGDKTVVYLKNDLKNYKCAVDAVERVPVTEWTSSPLLDFFGGPIQVIPFDNYTFRSKERYYSIKILPVSQAEVIPIDRTGTANIRVYKSLAGGVLKKVVSSLEKELTF